MSIKIGHSSIDENGKISGGAAGDQNAKEVCIRTWYSKPWQFVLRCKDSAKVELMSIACEKGCANEAIGYDQGGRNSLNTQAQKVNYDLSKIKTACECDCSSFMTVCAQAAGINIPYNGINAPTTSTMKSAFLSTGMFEVLTDSKYLTSDAYLKRGDILVKAGSHTVIALENGSLSSTTLQSTNTTKCIDVSSHQGVIKWSQVKSAGVNKAIIKVIRKDLNPDNRFEENYSGCKSSNIDVIGVYNYSYATNVAKAITDAQKVLYILNNRKTKIWLDVENDCQKGIGSLLKDIINAYQDVIESAGYEFGVYTGMSFYTSYIKPYLSQIKCSDWWIARYYNSYNKMDISINPNEAYNPKNTIGREICGWQYTSSGQLSGITGNVDFNVIYNVENITQPITTPSNSITETPITLLGKITTTSSNLTIRSQPNTTSTKLGYYSKASVIQLIAKTSNGWYKTDKGYISGSYVSDAIGQVYNCGGLNFRKSNESEIDNVIETLKPGDEINLLKEENGWYKAKAKLEDGTVGVGWVLKKYIKVL